VVQTKCLRFSLFWEYRRTVTKCTRNCAEVMSLVIEGRKSPCDLICYMFGQFSDCSPSNRATHVGIDKRLFSSTPAWGIPRRICGRDDIELLGRIGDFFFTFLTCYLFSTRDFCFLCYIIVQGVWLISYWNFKHIVCNLADMQLYLDEANTGKSCLIKQPQKQIDLNKAKCTSGFKIIQWVWMILTPICQSGSVRRFSWHIGT